MAHIFPGLHRRHLTPLPKGVCDRISPFSCVRYFAGRRAAVIASLILISSIGGRAQTLAVGIYTFVETGRENDAWVLLVISALLAFGAIFLSNRLAQSQFVRRRKTTPDDCASVILPSMLLLDEPLAAVDLERRDRLLPYLLRIRRELHVPLIYVTHDAAELSAIADRVLRLAPAPQILHRWSSQIRATAAYSQRLEERSQAQICAARK